MAKKKNNELANKNQAFLIYQDDNGIVRVNVRFEGEDVWLTQEQMMELFDASQQDVSYHIGQIYEEEEQDPERTHKKFLLVRQEGNRSVRRQISHYNLDMMNLLVSQYLDFAEIQALQQMPMRMVEWIEKLDELMKLSGRQLLVGKGSVTHEEAKQKAIAEFEKYRKLEMLQYESDYDRAIRELIDKERERQLDSLRV